MAVTQVTAMPDCSAFCIMIRRVIACGEVNPGNGRSRSESESEMGESVSRNRPEAV